MDVGQPFILPDEVMVPQRDTRDAVRSTTNIFLLCLLLIPFLLYFDCFWNGPVAPVVHTIAVVRYECIVGFALLSHNFRHHLYSDHYRDFPLLFTKLTPSLCFQPTRTQRTRTRHYHLQQKVRQRYEKVLVPTNQFLPWDIFDFVSL